MSRPCHKPAFYLDENLPSPIARCLQTVFRGAYFASSHETRNLDGCKDIPLLRYLAQQSFHYIITQDLKQMAIPDERKAVRNAGVSWVGMPHMEHRVKGKHLIAAQTALLLPVVAHLIHQVPTQPTAFYLNTARSYDELIKYTEMI